MGTYYNGRSETMQRVRKYAKVFLRYLIVFIIWTIKEIIILTTLISTGLRFLLRHISIYSAIAWKWIRWASPIVWAFTKRLAATIWRWTCIAGVYLWCWTKVLARRLARFAVVSYRHSLRWSREKHSQYLEFRRTKGFKGLADDIKTGVRSSFNQYMDEDQTPSPEVPMSDDELVMEDTGGKDTNSIVRGLDNFVKNIVNEKEDKHSDKDAAKRNKHTLYSPPSAP